MAAIKEVIQSLSPGTVMVFYELDIGPITKTNTPSDHYYFHNGANQLNQGVMWQGKEYEPFPVEGTGFDKTTKGTQPRPIIKFGNVEGIIGALCDVYGDLVGARVIRRSTFARYLDGASEADPNQHFPDDIYFVERRTYTDFERVEFELASASDLAGFRLPARQVTVNYCPWTYRESECGYTGTRYFNSSDAAVTTLAQDVCSKSVRGCKLRFGANAKLPFGGFPAARAYNFSG